MIDRLGVGWCFTVFAGIGAVTIPLLLMERHYGLAWRRKRDLKLGAKEGGAGEREMQRGPS